MSKNGIKMPYLHSFKGINLFLWQFFKFKFLNFSFSPVKSKFQRTVKNLG